MNTFGKGLQLFLIIFLALSAVFISASSGNTINSLIRPQAEFLRQRLLAFKEISLKNRQPNEWVNNIFKENILLNLAYLRGLTQPGKIDWEKVKQPFTYEFKLLPDQTFAFHEDIEATFAGKIAKTTNAHFNSKEGFKSDGYLFGDGVCHLASIMNWAAKEANLKVDAPTRHDFAVIPDIPKEYGVSIYNNPGNSKSNAKQNLYITNNHSKPIVFKFDYGDDRVKVSVSEVNLN